MANFVLKGLQLIKSAIKFRDKFTVIVEGNISSGKTSLLNYFDTHQKIETIPEPIHQWTNVGGINLLELMYKDPTRWGLCLQTYIQLTMLGLHTKQHSHQKTVKLMERSIYSAQYCFVENLYQTQCLQAIEYETLPLWFNWILANYKCIIDLIVYLQTDPSVLHERIQKRYRRGEQNISLEYLQSLHNLYEDWLIKKTRFSCPAPVLVLDGNCEKTDMIKQFEDNKKAILCGQL